MNVGFLEDVEHQLHGVVVIFALNKKVSLRGKDIVLDIAVARNRNGHINDLSESPTGVEVGVVRDDLAIELILDLLQSGNKVFGGLRYLSNTRFRPNSLVVAQTARNGTHMRNSVYNVVIHFLIHPEISLVKSFIISERLKEVAEIHNLYLIRNHQNVAVVVGAHHCGNVACVLCKALVLDLAVEFLLKLFCPFLELLGVVAEVGTVSEYLKSQTVRYLGSVIEVIANRLRFVVNGVVCGSAARAVIGSAVIGSAVIGSAVTAVRGTAR